MSEVTRIFHRLPYDERLYIQTQADKANMSITTYLLFLSEKEAAISTTQPLIFAPQKPK